MPSVHRCPNYGGAPPRSIPHRRRIRARGQATVELALVLPFVLTLAVAVAQAGVVARDAVRLVHATRVAARAAAVGVDAGTITHAAAESSGLDPARLTMSISSSSNTVTVTARYRAPTQLPLIGRLTPDPELHESLTMRREAPP